MKRFILGLLVGAILFVPLGVHAWGKKQMAQPIYGVDCDEPYAVDKDGQAIVKDNVTQLDPNGTNAHCSATVYVFDDAGNKCYVVKGSNASGISCLKASQR